MAKNHGNNHAVTNEKIFDLLVKMDEQMAQVSTKVDSIDSLTEIQSSRSEHLVNEISIVGARVKRFETQVDKRMSAFEDRMNETEGAIKSVVSWMTNMDERIVEIKETMATKNDLENLREDLLKEIRPLHKALDKDAETIVDHGKRIAVLEKHAGVATH